VSADTRGALAVIVLLFLLLWAASALATAATGVAG
jgi:hypothetical protein